MKDSGKLSIRIFGLGEGMVFTIGHFKTCPDCGKQTNWNYHIAKNCDENWTWIDFNPEWNEESYPKAYRQ